MNVGELKAALAEFPDDHDVQLTFTVASSGCCRQNNGDEWEERFAARVYASQYRDSTFEKGPRGGHAKWRIVNKPSVMIEGEY